MMEESGMKKDLGSGPQTSLSSSCLVRWALSKPCLLLGPQFLQHNQCGWNREPRDSLILLGFPPCSSHSSFPPSKTGHQQLKHHPSSLIYEVDGWTRKHNRDSPAHLQGRPQRAVILCTQKASGSPSLGHARGSHPVASIPG